MKKYVLLIAIVALLFTACAQPNIPKLLSASEALSIVEERVKDCEDKLLYCDYEGLHTIADRECHRIHVYTLSTKWLYDIDGKPYQQMFTYAWLYVDIYTGEIYQEEIHKGENGRFEVLVPWP